MKNKKEDYRKTFSLEGYKFWYDKYTQTIVAYLCVMDSNGVIKRRPELQVRVKAKSLIEEAAMVQFAVFLEMMIGKIDDAFIKQQKKEGRVRRKK